MDRDDAIKNLLRILIRIRNHAQLSACLKRTVYQICSGSGALRHRPYWLDCPLDIEEILAIEDPFLTDCYFTILHIQDVGYGATTLEEICYFQACFQKERLYSPEDFSAYLEEVKQSDSSAKGAMCIP